MKMFTLEKCCCCVKLTTGGHIIGFMGIVICIFYIFGLANILMNMQDMIDNYHKTAPGLADFISDHKGCEYANKNGFIFWFV